MKLEDSLGIPAFFFFLFFFLHFCFYVSSMLVPSEFSSCLAVRASLLRCFLLPLNIMIINAGIGQSARYWKGVYLQGGGVDKASLEVKGGGH